MSSYHRKIDANHKSIVKALREIGATVQSLAAVGKGCPDLLVGFNGRTILIEVKSDASYYGQNRILTEDEDKWHDAWTGGELYTLRTEEEAIRAVMHGKDLLK